MEDLGAAFRALADPHRRTLLDGLRDRDGQTLGELEMALPEMTRFGVMKHLRVLEEAGLVTTRRDGRRKLHYLNPVPIRLIADRWISRYAAPLVDRMADVKHSVEAARPMTAPKHVFEIYIQATPERVWQAITDPELTRGYYYGTAVESAWLPGSAVRYTYPDGSVAADGAVIEVDPPRRLVTTFSALWDETVRDEPPARVTWEIEPMGDACRVALTFGDMVKGSATERSVAGGGSVLLSGMKTLLETGRSLTIGEPVGVSAG